jgi:hypothetical protein
LFFFFFSPFGLMFDYVWLCCCCSDRIAEHVSRSTIDTLNAALPVTLTETVPAAIKRILPSYLMHALEHTLTHTLTRSLTHTLSATLAHTLSISPQREAVCFYCTHYQLLLAECRSCLAQKRAQYSSHYYRHHFASYFSDYYTGNPPFDLPLLSVLFMCLCGVDCCALPLPRVLCALWWRVDYYTVGLGKKDGEMDASKTRP